LRTNVKCGCVAPKCSHPKTAPGSRAGDKPSNRVSRKSVLNWTGEWLSIVYALNIRGLPVPPRRPRNARAADPALIDPVQRTHAGGFLPLLVRRRRCLGGCHLGKTNHSWRRQDAPTSSFLAERKEAVRWSGKAYCHHLLCALDGCADAVGARLALRRSNTESTRLLFMSILDLPAIFLLMMLARS